MQNVFLCSAERKKNIWPDEGDVLDGAARLGEAWSGQLLYARYIVRPAADTQLVQYMF